MRFSDRLPSADWEAIPLAGDSSLAIWAWFRPPAAPQGIFLQIPEETFRAATARQLLTLRTLAQTVEVEPSEIASWSLYGVAYDGLQTLEAVWDHSLPKPAGAPDSTIGLFLHPDQAIAAPLVVDRLAGAYADPFSRMDAEWNACIQLEVQIGSAAQQLKFTVARLGSLNRDLGIDEARFSDRRDKNDWQDARRWIRDVADRASRFLKDYQTGAGSPNGKRVSLEYLHRTYIQKRLPFEGMEQSDREFEAHRKTLQNLLSNLSAANSSAMQDGERRAQQVLTRIAAKIRSARSKR